MATYYWRGGSGTWNVSSTTNWSNTSGGAGGFGPPTDADTVIFDTNSAIGFYTVQCGIGSVCARITATAPAAGAGAITFSNTVENSGIMMYCGSTTGALTTSLNIYNGAIFTAGTLGAEISLFCYATGTSTITFNNSGATTQSLNIAIRQGSNGAYSNTVNFCNGHTQTFASVQIQGGYNSGYVTSTTYNTFNCTTATISIIGGSNGYEAFAFGSVQATDYFSRLQLEFAGNVALTSTSITIGAAATLTNAAYGGIFCMNSVSGGSLSCSGTSISILRVPTIQTTFTYYFYISPYYTCSTQLANLTLSNGMPAASGYIASIGNVPGLSGNLVVSNTVSNAAGLYLSVFIYYYANFTVAGTTTITAASLELYPPSSYNFTHTGAVSVVGSAIRMCNYYNYTTGTITFSSTLSSTNPTTNTSAIHYIIFQNAAGVNFVGNVSLIDTFFYAVYATTTGAANTWTHGTVNGLIDNGATIGTLSFTKGITTLTNAVYNLTGQNVTHLFAAVTLIGSTLQRGAYDGYITTTGNLRLQSYSATRLSIIEVTSVSVTGTLVSTNVASSTSTYNYIRLYNTLTVSSTVNLADTLIIVTGNITSGAYTHGNFFTSAAVNLINTASSIITTGAITLTDANYNPNSVNINSGASNLTLSGSLLDLNGGTLSAAAVLLTSTGTRYSGLYTNAAGTSITSLNSISSSPTIGYHQLNLYTISVTTAISLADTVVTISYYGAINCSTYTHANAATALALPITNSIPNGGLVTTGAISITNATYTISSGVAANSGASNVTLSGTSLTSSLGGITAATLALTNNTTRYSTVYTANAVGVVSLTSTSTSTGNHSIYFGQLITTGAVSLVDTTYISGSTTTIGTTWAQTKTATGTTTGSNVFGGNATFGGNTSFQNSDVVFLGQTNSVTGTFTFTLTSLSSVVSTGSYITNDNPAITFLYAGPSTFSVSGAFSIIGDSTLRTNVRTFVPYANSEPVNFKYNQVTISVASVSLFFVNFQNVTASGATPWAGTLLGNATGNTNITFPAAATRFLVATTGTVQSNAVVWANSSGGATSVSNFPLPQDTIVIDNNSASVGAVTLNFATVIYATNIVGQASINRQVTFSRADRSSLILLGNITLFTPTAGGLVFNLLNITLDNASTASAHILSWPTGYAPIATSNTVYLYTYSLGSMTLSGSTSASAYLGSISNQTAAPASGSYGSLTITDGVETYANIVQIANSTVHNFTSSTIYTTIFNIPQVAVTSYTLSSAYATFSNILGSVGTNYVGTLNLVTAPYIAPVVFVTSIGTLNISIYNPINVPVYMYIASCTVGNMTGGGTDASNRIFLYGGGGGAGTLTKSGGGFVQLNYVRPYNLSASPANTFYATNSSLASGGTATGWTFTAAPTATAGGNFFLEF